MKPRRGTKVGRSKAKTVRPEDKIAFYDLKTKGVRAFRKDKFREQLDRVVTALQDSAKRPERIGEYRLEEIEIRLGVSAGLVVVTLEGGISLRNKRGK